MLHRVQKIISNAGLCSRRKAEELIDRGLVKVNGSVIHLGDKADPEKDEIIVEGKKLQKTQLNNKIYLLLNKPMGYITTLDDPRQRRTILDLFKQNKITERVYPVGRLDRNTEGLIILTNDGDFANRIMHPRYEIKKTYTATIDRPLKDEDKKKLETGIMIEEKKTWPAEIEFKDKNKQVFNITIHEGRNRIVRKMMEALNYNITALRRVSVGSIKLGNLPLGKIREMTKDEVDSLVK